MLSWFLEFIWRPGPPQAPPAPTPGSTGAHIAVDDGTIRATTANGVMQEVRWAALTGVDIKATLVRADAVALAWVLKGRDGRPAVTVPMGARGEHEFILAMQRRLSGFDNMAVVEAMSTMEASEFQIWPPLMRPYL